MRKLAVLGVAVLLLCSCIGIDSSLSIRADGSGTLTLTYRVSQLVVDVGLSQTGTSVVPLPLTRADFERSLQAGKVRLTRFDRSENAKDITIRAVLAFDSFDALAGLEAFHDAGLSLTSDGSRMTFRQLIARAPSQPPSEESLQMLDALFPDYDVSFVIQAPRPIVASSLGTLSDDKRTLTYRASVKEVVSTKSDLVLTASW